ncbi:uncharacterized protein N0V89_011766 [Didymosphaeria variabile]|uniref:Uncharacterized protein n=1 Tax=Didymosphaeria variabile TaxID=1932322 RepID=A0A9W9C5M8_9PLEO|nr:uncharacterized protein N0V89_011766 [Didymosphaeria variabile]KAJ4345632.1 hypothetical protein N0V89_011766 [Didymosphaeria variabile]
MNRPRISIEMEMSPNTYHFSSARPPTLSFTLTPHASQCLTILVPHSSPLATGRSMNTGGYPISDLSTSPPTTVKIGDMTGYISVPASPNEMIVLQPGQRSKKFQVAFNRGASYEPSFRPQPWHIVRNGRLLDQDGKETSIRRPSVVHGVDGLEAGKTYKTTMAIDKLEKTPWWWGDEKDEPDRKDLGSKVGGIEWEIVNGGVEFRVEE